jgi:hypothetical protein
MARRLCGIALIGLLLPACTRDEWLEYDVKAASRRDVQRTRQIMQEIAAEAGIPPHFGGSYSPSPPIAIYIRGSVQLSAFFERGEIRVWLMRNEWPASRAFIQAKQSVESAFPKAFGSRFVAEPPATGTRVVTD